MIKLNGAGKIFWEKANGRTTVLEMVDSFLELYPYEDKINIYNSIATLMERLRDKGLVIMNWDPLYKDDLEQKKEIV